MIRLLRPIVVLFLALAAFSVSAAAPSPRQRLLLDAGWRFQRITASTLAHSDSIATWRRHAGQASDAALMTAADADTSRLGWTDTPTGQESFGGRPGFAWYRATLPSLSFPKRTLHFEAVDDNATVYLNGKLLVHHEGWNDPFDVPLDSVWRSEGPNIVAVLVENQAGGGGITGPVTLGTRVPPAANNAAQTNFNDKSWAVVHLPHDYVLEAAFTPQGDASHGSLIPTPAWYRKTFSLPASDQGKDLWLDFDGVYRDSKVYLNGQLLGEHPCGYTPFRYDITQAAHYGGPNVLAVQVNPQKEEGWWYEGGGIYRHVWLNVADPVHIAPWGTFVTAKLPEPESGHVAPATVTIKTAVDSATITIHGQKPTFSLISQVLDPNGKVVAATTTPFLYKPGHAQYTQQVTITHPLLWSIETPRLYHLHTEIDDRDATDTPFGIRTIRFDPDKGFFLNGKHVEIKGTCNHQDFAGVGIGMPDSLLYWRIKKLKEMGSNAYRMSHNPPTAEILDACDRLGMLVMDENRHLGDTEAGKASAGTPTADLHELESMILRDRNHPSIIMWSMCNEESLQGSADGARIFHAMKAVVDQDDGTRPVTCAMSGGWDSPAGISSVEDLQGINYSPGVYDRWHQAHPTTPLYGSETASTVSTRGVYAAERWDRYVGDRAKGYVSAYDLNAPPWAQTAEVAWQAIADRPFVAGGYVWTGFDYKGEPTPFAWPDVNSNFGIMDECGFPKDGYYYYQAVWGDKPIVHILPHWNWPGKEGQPINVWAYSNTAEVELWLNGTSLGRKTMPKNSHLEWNVSYAPGTLAAKGYDANGKVIAADTVATTGAPAALKLSTARTKLTADGEDLTMVEVDVVDTQGRIVPTAANNVTFTVTGTGHLAGVGNGDPSDHDPDKAGRRRAFNGKCLVIVGANEQPGSMTLTADSPGLKNAALRLSAER